MFCWNSDGNRLASSAPTSSPLCSVMGRRTSSFPAVDQLSLMPGFRAVKTVFFSSAFFSTYFLLFSFLSRPTFMFIAAKRMVGRVVCTIGIFKTLYDKTFLIIFSLKAILLFLLFFVFFDFFPCLQNKPYRDLLFHYYYYCRQWWHFFLFLWTEKLR